MGQDTSVYLKKYRWDKNILTNRNMQRFDDEFVTYDS
jgi:hypothetical protein